MNWTVARLLAWGITACLTLLQAQAAFAEASDTTREKVDEILGPLPVHEGNIPGRTPASNAPTPSSEARETEATAEAEATAAPEEQDLKELSPKEREEVRRQRVADILAQRDADAPELEYTKPRNCISASRYREVRVLNEHYVAFVGRKTAWVNELRRRCHGLRDEDTISFETRGNRICLHSRFESFDMFFGGQMPIATCFLGDFHEVTRDELSVIETAMD